MTKTIAIITAEYTRAVYTREAGETMTTIHLFFRHDKDSEFIEDPIVAERQPKLAPAEVDKALEECRERGLDVWTPMDDEIADEQNH